MTPRPYVRVLRSTLREAFDALEALSDCPTPVECEHEPACERCRLLEALREYLA